MGAVVASPGDSDSRWARCGNTISRGWTRSVVAVLSGCLTMVAAGCSSDGSPSVDAMPSADVVATRQPAEVLLQVTFDSAKLGGLRAGDTVPLYVPEDLVATVVAPDSMDVPDLRIVDRDGVRAVEFPDPCDLGPRCRRQILEVPDFDAANPGTGDFSLGARLSVRRDDIRDGANILQKGFSTDGEGQWKLQVDKQDGLPSCVLVPSGSQAGYTVKSELDVADGDWHVIECGRSAREWWIDVDGVRSSEQLPSGVRVSNDSPIRIGGKNVAENADPFFGLIDEVWMSRPED